MRNDIIQSNSTRRRCKYLMNRTASFTFQCSPSIASSDDGDDEGAVVAVVVVVVIAASGGGGATSSFVSVSSCPVFLDEEDKTPT